VREGAQGEETQKDERWSVSKLLTVAASIVSLLTIGLLICGYGVSLCVEDFGIPHAMLFDSVADLLPLSVWGVLHIANGLTGFFRNGVWWDFLRPDLYVSLLLFGILFILALCSGFVRGKKRRAKTGRSWGLDNWLVLKKEDIMYGASWKSRLCEAAKVTGSMSLLLMLGQAVFIMTLLIVITSLFLVPMIAIQAGNNHIADGVIRPKSCRPLYNLERRLRALEAPSDPKTKLDIGGAFCVSVSREGKQPEKGRVIFSTSSAVVLYDPKTGATKRVPLAGAVVEAISSLDGQAESRPMQLETSLPDATH